jgi:hypothetical protein
MSSAQSLRLDAKGFHIVTEARLVRADIYGGVFHVLSEANHDMFDPPIVVIIPGKWMEEDVAHRAARDYAVVMANNGSLRGAVDLRLSIA